MTTLVFRTFSRHIKKKSFFLALCAAAIMYRVPFTWQHKKHTWKLVHSGLLLSALLLSTLGLCAVFDFHSGYHIPDLYSLHSWVGICTTFLFALQVRHNRRF